MTKAEEKALEAYPVNMTPLVYQDLIDQFGGKTEIDVNTYPRCLFQEGYEQAEKDLVLTWEDIGTIAHLIYIVNQEFHTRYDQDETGEFDFSRQDVYEEVLKRFMEEQK